LRIRVKTIARVIAAAGKELAVRTRQVHDSA
jgi:hypothetical protein